MKSPSILIWFVTAAAAALLRPAPADAQNAAPLAGVWTLNRALSEWPKEIGFDVNWIPSSGRGGQDGRPESSGRGRRGSGSGGAGRGGDGGFSMPRVSYD